MALDEFISLHFYQVKLNHLSDERRPAHGSLVPVVAHQSILENSSLPSVIASAILIGGNMEGAYQAERVPDNCTVLGLAEVIHKEDQIWLKPKWRPQDIDTSNGTIQRKS